MTMVLDDSSTIISTVACFLAIFTMTMVVNIVKGLRCIWVPPIPLIKIKDRGRLLIGIYTLNIFLVIARPRMFLSLIHI